MNYSNLILNIFIIILIILLCIGTYEILANYLHDRYQTEYRNNNKWYWPHSSRPEGSCLNGCRLDKTCPRGSLCYDCQGSNPSCCCYDSQCAGCGN